MTIAKDGPVIIGWWFETHCVFGRPAALKESKLTPDEWILAELWLIVAQ